MKTLKTVSFGIKNNRVLAGFMLLICGFVFPVIAVMSGPSGGSVYSAFIPLFGTTVAYFAGILFPIVFFSYTHNRREYDFYAAMPIKKRQFFWGYFIAGIIMFIVPLFIMDFMLMMLGGGRGSLKLSYFIVPLASFFSLYCSMTLAVMFSGSVVSTVITFLLRNIFVICLVVPILFMAGVNIESYYILLYDKAIITSPLLSIAPIFAEDLWWIMIWQVGIGILEVIAAFFLHKYRRSETTMALAFPKSRLPYQYIVLLMFIMTVNTVVLIILGLNNGIFNRGNYEAGSRFSWDSGDIKTIVFFDVISAFLMFMFLNIVLERSSRAAFKGIRHLLFFLVGFFAVAGLSGRLLNYIPKIYTPIDPDYAVVSVYRPIDPSTVDTDSEEFNAACDRDEYQYGAYYLYDEDTDDYSIHIDWVHAREDFFIVTSQKNLDELVRICEGEASHYNITGLGYFNQTGYIDSPYHNFENEDQVLYFKIILFKGRCEWGTNRHGETVCTHYRPKSGLLRSGYVIGTGSGLDIYREYDIELPQQESAESHGLLPGASVIN